MHWLLANTAVILLLHAADEALTWQGLQAGGREFNPVARQFTGTRAALRCYKIALVSVILGLGWLLWLLSRPWWAAMMALHHAATGATVAWNLYQVRDLQREGQS